MPTLTDMTEEELDLQDEILEAEKFDPNYRERIILYLGNLREKLRAAIEDITVSPERVQMFSEEVRYYGKLVAVVVKMNVAEKTKDDAFAEANVTAQKEEAEKLCD